MIIELGEGGGGRDGRQGRGRPAKGMEETLGGERSGQQPQVARKGKREGN